MFVSVFECVFECASEGEIVDTLCKMDILKWGFVFKIVLKSELVSSCLSSL